MYKIKVLFAVWELAPFIKVGGLGDVAKSLPIALDALGMDIRVILPYYKAVNLFGEKRKKLTKFVIWYNNKPVTVTLYRTYFLNAHIPVYLLKNTEFLSIPNKDTFAVFDLAVVLLAKDGISGWNPDIVHCNDFHCGFIPLLQKNYHLQIKSILTIHNIFHQGKTPLSIAKKMGIKDEQISKIMQWEIESKKINFLLEGILHADLVNTVSPSYAKEICTEEYGAGLNEIIQKRKIKIMGILNGLDYSVKNPETDPYINYHYGFRGKEFYEDSKLYSIYQGKLLNKHLLQKKLNLKTNSKMPFIGYIGRLASNQKGIDLIHKMLLRRGLDFCQFVLLGKGEEDWEERFIWLAKFYPENIYVQNDFDEQLASQIYAASDFILMPSKFEPCGLIQMIAMRYGAIPIARDIGGLKDVISNRKNGFLFSKYSSYELEKTLLEAITIKKNNPKEFNQIIINAMSKDLSWKVSAKKYVRLYKQLLKHSVVGI
ncbi:hypothetical protein A2Y99_01625 [Candidatus Gottesmanbacteria bacterium RBG_13_37_7]|uniref:Glycogen synthase n=1 Tax=Candidatus Gottesmanbacteria bacterium RBG_13_37_7 TaxID=1798369 RepID=A0A1F5YJ59_9BACT|nr:MAG: hypothetical protein A2Y99_01625 [Candidatus Gottesmanbacteria bacterium RBG_13_37_7]